MERRKNGGGGHSEMIGGGRWRHDGFSHFEHFRGDVVGGGLPNRLEAAYSEYRLNEADSAYYNLFQQVQILLFLLFEVVVRLDQLGQHSFIDFLRINQIMEGTGGAQRHLARRLPLHLVQSVQDASLIGANVRETVEHVLLLRRLQTNGQSAPFKC